MAFAGVFPCSNSCEIWTDLIQDQNSERIMRSISVVIKCVIAGTNFIFTNLEKSHTMYHVQYSTLDNKHIYKRLFVLLCIHAVLQPMHECLFKRRCAVIYVQCILSCEEKRIGNKIEIQICVTPNWNIIRLIKHPRTIYAFMLHKFFVQRKLMLY